MDKKDLINTQRVIKLLSYCKKLLKPEDIENNFIDEAINSLKRKIDMGKNPYKFRSSGSWIDSSDDDLRWILDD